MGFYQDFLDGLRGMTGASARFRTEAELARAAGVEPAQIHKYTHEISTRNIEKLGAILDKLGARLVFDEPSAKEVDRDVCFVDARLMPAGRHVPPPQAEDYIAAPLVGEVGAGPGYLPQEDVKSWFLVYRRHPAIQFRRNLIAVEIAKNSTSMLPLLKPGDLVLVDRDDRDVSRPGHIMLVRDPYEQGMVKRVAVEAQEDGDFSVIYYSDNAMENPPVCHSLRKDFLGEWDRAIVGRVIWAWSDVREK